MESLGIALGVVALVSIGAIVTFAVQLVGAHRNLAQRDVKLYAMEQRCDQQRVAMQDLERERNKAVTNANTMEDELMALASTAGEPAVRLKLHKIWTDRIRAVGRDAARPVPNDATTDPSRGIAFDPTMLGDGAVPDYDEFAVSGAPTVAVGAGAADPKRLAEMFARRK